nr:MAG TPA: hypothetical protein [Caudoviricetes sp.]
MLSLNRKVVQIMAKVVFALFLLLIASNAW